MTDKSEDIKFLRLADVLALVPVSESTLYRMISKKEFPRAVKVGGLGMWVESKVKDWMKLKAEEDDEII